MISKELLRRYPFFSGFSDDQLDFLASVGNDLHVDIDHFFFKEEDEIDCFYLVMEGNVNITINIPDRKLGQSLVQQLTVRPYPTQYIYSECQGDGIQ